MSPSISARGTRAATESWLPDALSSRILRVYRKKALAEAQARVTPKMKVEKAFKTVQKTFKEIGFEGVKGSALPVKLL